MIFDCFLWAPTKPLVQLELRHALFETEHAAGRIVPINGFVPSMFAGLRLLLDPTPLQFPEPKPNHWPPPGPPTEVRNLLARAHRACQDGHDHPFAELRARADQDADIAEVFASALMEPADYSAEFWEFWRFPPVSALSPARRQRVLSRWIEYPPSVWLRGSADLRERPKLDDILTAVETFMAIDAPFDRVVGWALEA